MRIDSHQHFWKFDPVRDSWINDEMKVIQRDFLPSDLEPVLKENGFQGCITVQSDQSEAENQFQIQNAQNFPFIKGVVGWVDFEASDIEEKLQHYRQFPALKGFRHVLQGEKQRDYMLRRGFMHGISCLSKHNFTYDILIFPDQLQYTSEFVAAFPNQRFVIDHLAKPYIKDRKLDGWKQEIEALAAFENLSVKISGMITEAEWKSWKKEDFKPYLDAVVNTFGIERIMFGSDWPVCLVAANDYAEMLGIVSEYFSAFSATEQDAFFGGNAAKFYSI